MVLRMVLRPEYTDQVLGPWGCMRACYQHPSFAVGSLVAGNLVGNFAAEGPAVDTPSVVAEPVAVASFAVGLSAAEPFVAGMP